MSPHEHVEVIHYREPWQTGNECYEIQCAINGVLALPGQVHASFHDIFVGRFGNTNRAEEEFMRMMINGQRSMIEMFGDAREQWPVPLDPEALQGAVC